MQEAVRTTPSTTAASLVLWRAEPRTRAVVREIVGWLLMSGLFVAVMSVIPHHDPLEFWGWIIPVAIGAVRSLSVSVRGSVVLTEDAIEVRKLATRRYPWASLSSVTIDEDGHIEITPEGWVRLLPIPRSQVPAAFETINRWRDKSSGSRTDR